MVDSFFDFLLDLAETEKTGEKSSLGKGKKEAKVPNETKIATIVRNFFI